MSVLNPALLGGLVLIGVPILIHFFMTRRKLILPWAAYEFIRRALLKKKERIQKENLLQLILRILAIAALALALARPLLGPGRSAERALLLLDSTCSMQAVEDGVSRFDKARALAKAWIAGAPAGSSFAVGCVDAQAELATARLSESAADAVAAIDTLRPSARSATLAETLARIQAPVEALKPSRVLLFSDFNSLGRAEEIQLRLAALPRDVALQLVPVSRLLNARNVALSRLACESGWILTNRPAVLGVDVVNTSPEPWKDYKLVLQIDGRVAGETVLDLAGGQTVRATFPVTFRDATPRFVSIQGPSDALGADSAVYAPLAPFPPVRVAALSPATPAAGEVFDAELGFLEAAYANLARQEAVLLEKSGPAAFPWTRLADYHVVVLANAGDPGGARAEALGRFVRNGGGLLLFPGGGVRPADWNAWARRDPELLPATLEGPVRAEAELEISAKGLDGAVFGFLQENEEALARIRFRSRFHLTPAVGARVLARFAGEDAPVGVARTCGRGTVLAFAFPVNRSWGDFAVQPEFVAFAIRSLLAALGPPPRAGALPGETLVFALPPERADQEMTVDAPGARQAKVRALFQDGQAVVRYAGASDPGFYRLRCGETLLGGAAVNVDGLDSVLAPATARELRAVAALSDRVALGDERGRGAGGYPLSVPLMLLAALAVAGETWVTFLRRRTT